MAATELQIDAANRLQITLESVKQGQANQISQQILELGNELGSTLSSIDDLQSLSVNQLNAALARLGNSVEGYLRDTFFTELESLVDEVTSRSVNVEIETLNQAIESKDFEAKSPINSDIMNEYNNTPLTDGVLIAAALASLIISESDRVKNTVRSSYFNGQSTQDAILAVRGRSSNRFRDGALEVTRRNLESTMRTAAQHAMISARAATFKSNDLNKYEWVSTLDAKTSTQCKSLDGNVYEISKGPMPPIHYNCRSTIVASLDGRLNLNAKDGTRTERGPSGKTGRVDADTTYYEWLKRQPADFQDRALGRTRGSLFRNGGLSAEEFARLSLNRRFVPLTLAEMRAIEPQAFVRAGI